MRIIAERINATRKPIARALETRDAPFLQAEARRQADAGAEVIDINTAFSPETERDLMAWAVETVRAATDRTLAVDTASPEVARAGLERLPKGAAVLNSASGEAGRLRPMAELAAEFEADLIVMAMDDGGMPQSVEDRWRALDPIFAVTDSLGVPRRRLLVDPLIRPVSTNPEQAAQCLEAIRSIAERGGGAGTVVGLSNISFGLPNRRHLNRTFLAMALSAGLTAAILDPLEQGLVATALAGACLRGEDEYCTNYIAAQRQGRL